MLTNSKGVSTALLLTVIVIVLAVCITTAFIAFQYKPTQTPSPTAMPTATPTLSPTSTPAPTTTPTPTPSPNPTQTSTPTPQPTVTQGTVAVQAVQVTAAPTGGASLTLTIYAQAQGNPVGLSNVILKDAGGNVKATTTTIAYTAPSGATSVQTGLTTLTATYTGISPALATGTSTYTVTLVGANGGSFVSPSFTVTVPAP